MTNSWMNEDGEPIMDGAAYRFEQQLDADYAEQRYLDDDDFFGPDGCDDDTHGEDRDQQHDGSWVCALCGEPCEDDEDDLDPMEDQWLDGSYEE